METGTEIREQIGRKLRREAEAKRRMRRVLDEGAHVEEGSVEARLLDAGRRWAEHMAPRIEEAHRVGEHAGWGLPADDLALVRDLLWERADDEEWAEFFSILPVRIRLAREREAVVDASYRVGSGMLAAYLRGQLTDGGDFVAERVLRRYTTLRAAEHAAVDDCLACDHMRDLDLVDDDDAFEIERIVFS